MQTSLDYTGLPPFQKIDVAQIPAAVGQIIEENLKQIDALASQPEQGWDSLVLPLQRLDDRLSRAWSPVSHLNSVRNSDEMREAYQQSLPLLSDYSTQVGQNQALFAAYQGLYERHFDELKPAQQAAVQQALRDFRLSGVDLNEADKKRYQEIQQRLSELTTQYSNQLLDATQAWELPLPDAHRLLGLPESSLDLLRQYAEQKEQDGFLINLEMPSYIAVMTYADDRELRRELYEAYSTRASDQGPQGGEWDNGPLMVEILQLRQEKAQLLGFAHYAELSLAPKMADSVESVLDFLHQLRDKSQAAAQQDVKELQAFAEQQGFGEALQSWDVAYYSEKLREQRYEISEEALKPYFPAPRVIEGLFGLTQQLFGVDISPSKAETELWHDSVQFFDIARDGEVIARFYLDLYARPQKRGGAWMDVCMNRFLDGSTLQLPVAYLTCNLTPPIGDKAALFTHDEVITVFHEFGHGLHHMLTRVDVPDVAGINGVEWDAVELPSQFMENWCWQKGALDLFARHYESGETMPPELFERMLAAKNFQSALQMLRQIEFSLFDFELHQRTDIESSDQIQALLDQVREHTAVIKPPAYNRFQNGFSHIFAGGYAAGYYSYKWAEVLSADAFAAFEEEGLTNPETGRRYLENILEVGASRPAAESFAAFRGRPASIDALLRHNGIGT